MLEPRALNTSTGRRARAPRSGPDYRSRTRCGRGGNVSSRCCGSSRVEAVLPRSRPTMLDERRSAGATCVFSRRSERNRSGVGGPGTASAPVKRPGWLRLASVGEPLPFRPFARVAFPPRLTMRMTPRSCCRGRERENLARSRIRGGALCGRRRRYPVTLLVSIVRVTYPCRGVLDCTFPVRVPPGLKPPSRWKRPRARDALRRGSFFTARASPRQEWAVYAIARSRRVPSGADLPAHKCPPGRRRHRPRMRCAPRAASARVCVLELLDRRQHGRLLLHSGPSGTTLHSRRHRASAPSSSVTMPSAAWSPA